MTSPSRPQFLTLGTIARRHHHLSIQLDKNPRTELGPRVGHRPSAQTAPLSARRQLAHKLMQARLQRFEALLQQQNHHYRKSQPTLAGKILWPTTMSKTQCRINDPLTKSFDEAKGTFF